MKISDLQRYIKENQNEDIQRTVRAALMSLKANNIAEIKTSQVLKDFQSKGINVSLTELLNMIQNDPMISNANKDTISFAKDVEDIQVRANKSKEEQDKNTISSMAKTALKSRGL